MHQFIGQKANLLGHGFCALIVLTLPVLESLVVRHELIKLSFAVLIACLDQVALVLVCFIDQGQARGC